MSDMVSVPAEKIAALRETISWMDNPGPEDWGERLTPGDVVRAARAVVDAVETERGGKHAPISEPLPLPSPARDDAEKAIAGLLPDHQPRWGIQYDGKGGVAHPEDGGIRCFCGWESGPSDGLRPWPKFWQHVASVIAAHMAAPDELTALPTVPGSVIEAATTGSASLWMRGAQNTWFKEDGEHAADADLRLLRVLFDAGKGWTTP